MGVNPDSEPDPREAWDQEHADRKAAGQEGGHRYLKSEPATENTMPRSGITDRRRPRLHYYQHEEGRRLRFQLNTREGEEGDAVVIRVQDHLGPQDNAVPDEGDPTHGLFVLDTGEIVISLSANGGEPVRFEFKVDNPGNGVSDYQC